MSIDSYNSRYPLQYYEIGKPYMFYNRTGRTYIPTDEQIEKYSPVFATLKEQPGIQPMSGWDPSKKEGIDRYIGVVVEHETLTREVNNQLVEYPMIHVLFRNDGSITTGITLDSGEQSKKPKKTETGEFFIKKYAVGSETGVFLDDNENAPAMASLHIENPERIPYHVMSGGKTGITAETESAGTVGIKQDRPKTDGGTRDNKAGKATGVTADKSVPSKSGVTKDVRTERSGITADGDGHIDA